MDEQGLKQIATQIFEQTYPALMRGVPYEKSVADEMAKRKFLGSTDRRIISDMLWKPIRHLAFLYWSLEEKEKSSALAIFNASFLPMNYDKAPINVQYETPLFLYEQMPQKELEAMNNSCSLSNIDIRVNISKMKRDKAALLLKNEGINTKPTPFASAGLRAEKRFMLDKSIAYKRGLITMQDEGSQLICEKIAKDIKKGDKVLDLCAGAGGKTLALYDYCLLKSGEGTVDFTATDIDEGRLKNLKNRAMFAGFKAIKTQVLPADYQPFLENHTGFFNIVLVDAPCSGTGVWKRSPDAKWRIKPDDLENYENIETDILAKAAKMVQKEGFLFYVTCSLRTAENEEQIAKFIKNNPSFVADYQDYIYPSAFGTDGFFIAKLIKK